MWSDRRAGINSGERFAQRDGSVRLAVAERHGEKPVEIEPHLAQFAQADGAHAALAHIHLDDVLPRRLHPLHFKLFDFHRRIRRYKDLPLQAQ